MNSVKMDIPGERNTESMFSCGLLTSFSCEHNKHFPFATGPCDSCKVMSLYGSSPKSDHSFTPSSSYGSPPGKGFTLEHSKHNKKEKQARQVRWTSKQPEMIPDIDEDVEIKTTEQSVKPKSILKQRETCMVVVHAE